MSNGCCRVNMGNEEAEVTAETNGNSHSSHALPTCMIPSLVTFI